MKRFKVLLLILSCFLLLGCSNDNNLIIISKTKTITNNQISYTLEIKISRNNYNPKYITFDITKEQYEKYQTGDVLLGTKIK